jgi:uncharacterized membrane protein YjjB (DUF3815 family)
MDTLIRWLLPFLTATVASLAWAVLFQVPRRRLLLSGLVGGGGWMAWLIAKAFGWQIIGRTLFGALVIGLCGELLARLVREPATVFITSGIVPLVPGATTFAAMQAFVVGDYLAGISQTTEALLAAGAIAAGLAIAAPLVRGVFLLFRRR